MVARLSCPPGGHAQVMPGKTHGGHIAKGRGDVYDALRTHGHTKKSAAKIANAGKTKDGRSRMAKKAARTRKRHGR
jgi:hypothetical protein